MSEPLQNARSRDVTGVPTSVPFFTMECCCNEDSAMPPNDTWERQGLLVTPVALTRH